MLFEIFRDRPSSVDVFGMLPRFLENLLEIENLICTGILPGRKPYWVSPSSGSIISPHLFSTHLAYAFRGRLRREMPG